MSHKRIRKFNTKKTYPEQKLDNDLCQAVIAKGKIVFLRGQVSQNLDTSESLHFESPAKQAEKTMENIKFLLEQAGSSLHDLCRIVVYLTDIRHRDEVYRSIGPYLVGIHPVSTGIVVSALARPEWVVEIEATAVIPDSPIDNYD